jgi:hypothetical protein
MSGIELSIDFTKKKKNETEPQPRGIKRKLSKNNPFRKNKRPFTPTTDRPHPHSPSPTPKSVNPHRTDFNLGIRRKYSTFKIL